MYRMNLLRLTILDRYLLKEILQTLAAILLVLMLIVLSNKTARFLKNAASGEWPVEIIMPMLGLTAVSSLALIMPVAVFLAVLSVTGRLYKDNEMTVINSCGVSTYRLYRPLVILAIILGAIVGPMSFYVVPVAKQAARILQTQAEQISAITGVAAGRFHQTSGGRRVIYIEHIDAGQAENIFIHERDRGGFSLMTAQTASQQGEAGTLIYLQDGYRYQGGQETGPHSAIQFKRHWIQTGQNSSAPPVPDHEALYTRQLLGSDNPYHRAELHMRTITTLSPMLFAFLGLPLGRLQPREGRYGKIMLGVLIYIIYFKLLRVGQELMEQETLSPWPGLWWAPLGLTLYLLWTLHSESTVRPTGYRTNKARTTDKK